MSPGWRQVIIGINAGISFIGTLWTNFSELVIEIKTFSFKEMHVKMSSAMCRPLCLGFNVLIYCILNTLRPGQDGRHFANDIFKWIFWNENTWILIKISLKFVYKGQINNIPALVQIMAWRRPGDKPLSEPMMVSLPTHICVTRHQWVNTEY